MNHSNGHKMLQTLVLCLISLTWTFLNMDVSYVINFTQLIALTNYAS